VPEQQEDGREMSEPFKKSDDGSWIEVTGFVRRLLSDDNEGSRHQRFILDIGNRRTLLIAHNIDLAKRVPLGMGDRVRVRGMYEWNDLGGLMHWTHHDPLGVEDGGFIRYRTRVYQ
tara:strand:+ start:3296 stop:3643 length:348 start_codon:yes stop_codon:yes gene_type:complete